MPGQSVEPKVGSSAVEPSGHDVDEKELSDEGLIEPGTKVWFVLRLLPEPVRPYAIQLIGYGLIATACLAGLSWVDQRVDGHILKVQSIGLDKHAAEDEEVTKVTKALIEDHEKRLQLLEKSVVETHDAVIEMRPIVRTLSDHDDLRYRRGR